VVINVGGFLGTGEHDVAVPFDQTKFVTEFRSFWPFEPLAHGENAS
jgi:hypothetical protein